MKRSLRVVVPAVLALLLVGPVPNSLARPMTGPRVPVGRTAAIPKALDVGDTTAAGYGTGTIVHADALRTQPEIPSARIRAPVATNAPITSA